MILMTRLDGTTVLINVDQIESIEQTPDTMVTLANGHKMLAREAPDELVTRIVAFKRQVERSGPREVPETDSGRRSGVARWPK